MTVYVDKKGRLAAVEGSTNLYVEDTDVSEEGYIAVTFSCQLQAALSDSECPGQHYAGGCHGYGEH